MSRRRRPRNDRTMEVASEQHMTDEAKAHVDLIREQADEYTPAPMSDAEVDAEVEAHDDAAEEIAAGMADLEDEAPSLMAPETQLEPTKDPDELDDNPFLDDEATGDSYPRSDVEADVNNYMDTFPNHVELESVIDPEVFERGPLAASIRIFEAMLTQAKAGYIEAQVDELERVTEESFTADEREFLATVAAQEKTVTGLPDVAGAYRALVGIKARAAA